MLQWLGNVLLLPPLLAIQYLIDGGFEAFDASAYSIVAVLVVAPLLENICIIGAIEFLKIFELKTRTMVLCIAALSGVAHMIAGGLRAFSGAIGFAIMSYSYLLWRESSFMKRYAITVGQHVLMNAPPAVMLLMLD